MMGTCPFCNEVVKEDLLLYGGHCPHCFLEIPGEEAPTDPGEQASEREQMEARAVQSRNRKSTLVAVGLLGAAAAVGAGWLLTRPDPSSAVNELPEIVVNRDLSGHVDLPVPLSSAAQQDDPEGEVAKVSSAVVKSPRIPTGGQVIHADPEAPAPSSVFAPSTPGVNLDLGVSIDPNRGLPTAQVLSAESDIQNMISEMLGRYTTQVRSCYNTRLNQVEDLSGVWQVSFKVTKQGRVSKVSVQGRGVSDDVLEDCIESKVSDWTFKKISQEWPVSIPFRLEPVGR